MTLSAQAQVERIQAQLRKHGLLIERAFLEAISTAAGSIDYTALVSAIDRGDLLAAAQLVRMDQSIFWPLTEAMRDGYLSGAQIAALNIPQAAIGLFSFDGSHARAVEWLRMDAATLIEAIQADQIESVREVLAAGVEDGRSSASIARDIVGRTKNGRREGGILGLNSRQTDSIIRGRSLLASGDPQQMAEYLNLELRNKRFDATIRKAIREERPLGARQIDQIIEAHKSKALAYRGRVIAKQESSTALAAGKAESYQQMLDSGIAEAITKRWQHNLTLDAREDHQAMNGTTIDFRADFVFPDGVRMAHPKDPRGGAKHTIGCNCITVERVRLAR